jgi:hypothetical protein
MKKDAMAPPDSLRSELDRVSTELVDCLVAESAIFRSIVAGTTLRELPTVFLIQLCKLLWPHVGLESRCADVLGFSEDERDKVAAARLGDQESQLLDASDMIAEELGRRWDCDARTAYATVDHTPAVAAPAAYESLVETALEHWPRSLAVFPIVMDALLGRLLAFHSSEWAEQLVLAEARVEDRSAALTFARLAAASLHEFFGEFE